MYERAKQYTLARPVLKKSLGIAAVVFGILGLIIPGLPGILFLIIGLELLGIRFLILDRWLGRDTEAPPTA
jgi:uncharacterized membrane protein YbaN (DUF454 family)